MGVTCPRFKVGIAAMGKRSMSKGSVSFGTLRGVAIRKRILSTSKRLMASFANVIGPAMGSDGIAIAYLGGDGGSSDPTFAFASCPGAVFVKGSSIHGKGFDFAFAIPGSVSCSGLRKGVGLCTISARDNGRTRNGFSGFVIKKASSATRASAVNPRVHTLCLGSAAFMSNNRIGAAPCFITRL